MKKLSLFGLGLGVVFTMGCGTDGTSGPETLPDLDIPAEPANGLQLIMPIVRDLQPGTDYEICTWTDTITDREIDIRSMAVFQSELGHHLVLYYTTEVQPVGQRVCTDTDMASFRYIAASATGQTSLAPGNLVYRVPKGAQIVVNQHFLNATDEVKDGQSLANIEFAESGGAYTPSGASVFLNTELSVAEGISTQHETCIVDRHLKIWALVPHMHRWGTNIKVDLTRGGNKERMFDTEWDEEFTFHPPTLELDPATPMMLAPGDRVDIECTWNNDTGRALTFGFEMCLAFAPFIDDEGIGSIACDKGSWGPF